MSKVKAHIEYRMKLYFPTEDEYQKWLVTRNMFLEGLTPEQMFDQNKEDELLDWLKLAMDS